MLNVKYLIYVMTVYLSFVSSESNEISSEERTTSEMRCATSLNAQSQAAPNITPGPLIMTILKLIAEVRLPRPTFRDQWVFMFLIIVIIV